MSWIDELFNLNLSDIWNGVQKLYLLAQNIDNVNFEELEWLNNFFGMIRYLIGEPLFYMLCISFDIAIGFVLYKALKKIIDIVMQILNKIQGKFRIWLP